MVGAFALMVMGLSYTKRYLTFPHYHKNTDKPMLLSNGELHPMEFQPPSAKDIPPYTKHDM